MTRREEMELAWLNRAVQSHHRYDEKSFKEAAEWADRTMLLRISEYLRGKLPIKEIDKLCKVMEGESDI